MPGLDQTGPHGQGAMTGRKAGRCTNFLSSMKKEKTNPTVRSNDDTNSEVMPGRGTGTGMRRGQGGRGRGRGLGQQNRFRGV